MACCSQLSPTPKRRNSCATPERFKQPLQSKEAQPSGEAGRWSLRALFLPPQPPGPAAAAAGTAAQPLGCHEDAELGPLTQMAAAGTQALGEAFCPHCGCFLSDVGVTVQEQQHHVSHCEASAGPGAGSGSEEGGVVGGEDEDGAGSDDGSEAGEARGGEEAGELEEAGEDGPLGGVPVGYDEPEPILIEDDVVEAAGAAGEEGEEACSSGAGGGIRQWLEELGLHKYADCFLRAGADLSLLPFLSDQDLKQMGVATLGARKKILLSAADLAAGSVDVAPSKQDGYDLAGEEPAAAATGAAATAAAAAGLYAGNGAAVGAGEVQGSAGSSVGEWRALSGAGGAALFCGNIRRYFQPDGSKPPPQPALPPATGILQYFQPNGEGGAKPARVGPATAAARGVGRGTSGPDGAFAAAVGGPAGGRGRGRGKQGQWAHKAAQGDAPTGAGRRFGGGRGGAAQPVPLKPWHVVPGTAFVVDRFNSLPPGLPNKHWFLTHFHADHYKGLNSKFDRGVVYCSPPTAKLVQQQLRVAPARIKPHPLNTPFQVEGVRVTFLDANHCPGAVMILFEPPGQRPVLHTGDCRLVLSMQQEPALQTVRGKCDLILDTTYCSPEYAFPTQAEVLQFSIDAVKAEAFNPKTLFLFGSYTIGKERLFLEAARVLQRKVYVSATKRKVLDCLDLPPEYASLLTTNDAETNLHAVPLWMVTHKHMTKILKFYRGRFTNVVGFQPTGWTHQRDVNKTRARGRRQQKGTVITYQVPYSEHSSFTELREFVGWLNPVRIIPHVNTDNGGPKATRMVRLLRGQDPGRG